MATWCVLTRQSPDIYMNLTALERTKFLEAVEQTTPKR